MRKALLLSDFFYPHWTGISKSVDYLTQSLKDQFDFKVLTVRHEELLDKNENRDGVEIIRVDPTFRFSRTYFSLKFLLYLPKLIKNSDVVLINSPCTYIFISAFLAKIFRKKLIIFHQGDLILPGTIINYLIQFLFDCMTYMAFFLADGIFTYTQDYIDHSRLLPKFSDKAQDLTVPLPYFSDEKSEVCEKSSSLLLEKTKQQFKKISKKHDFLIGFAGRFVQEKGFDVLLKAIEICNSENLRVHYVFAGELKVSYEDTFQRHSEIIENLSDSISMLGLLDDASLMYFYSQLEIFVLPSVSECFGLVQAEAMAAGCPVLVSNIPGARDVVSKTGFGEIFQAGNSNELAEKLMSMVDRISLDKKYYQQNYFKVLSYFDHESAQKSLIEFIGQ